MITLDALSENNFWEETKDIQPTEEHLKLREEQ